jgi:hypothetical protein
MIPPVHPTSFEYARFSLLALVEFERFFDVDAPFH